MASWWGEAPVKRLATRPLPPFCARASAGGARGGWRETTTRQQGGVLDTSGFVFLLKEEQPAEAGADQHVEDRPREARRHRHVGQTL